MKTANADTPAFAQSGRERALGAAFELFSEAALRARELGALLLGHRASAPAG